MLYSALKYIIIMRLSMTFRANEQQTFSRLRFLKINDSYTRIVQTNSRVYG